MSNYINTENNFKEQFQSASEFFTNNFSGASEFFLWIERMERENESVYFSENVEKITGYTGEELKRFPGRGIAIVHDDDIHKVKKNMSDFLSDAAQTNAVLTYRVIKKNGSVIWIKESINAGRDGRGNVTELRGIATDITALKENEINLVKTIDNLKDLNHSKDRFISMLSHDLRAPFTSILGFSEILLNEPDLADNERLEYLNYINDSSQHQLQLINYLLDWSRLQTGRIKIESQRLNAQMLVFNCVSSLTGNAIRKNIEVKVNVKENLYIQADERLITQVVTNLLSNAIKFSHEGKIIEVSAEHFNEAMVEFIVRDEGTGISDENKSKIFHIEKLFSVEGTKGEKGTGLGLSLVREIIEKHEGEIWFYSDIGKGSEFHFTVPCSHNTILLVENDEELRGKFEKILRGEFLNFKIITAGNGYDALAKISDRQPSLVITDYEMPLMNGIQLIEFIRKEDKNFKVPVIALVSLNEKDKLIEYQHLKIDTVLQKPVDEELLISKIQDMLEY